MPVKPAGLLLLPFCLLVLALQIVLYRNLSICEDTWAGEMDSCFHCKSGAALEK